MSRMSNDQADLEYIYPVGAISTLLWLGSTVVDPILPLQIVIVGASIDIEVRV